MILGCLVVAYIIVYGWEHAKAQTGAEMRRAREHMAVGFTDYRCRELAHKVQNVVINSWAGKRSGRDVRACCPLSRLPILGDPRPAWRR